MYPNYPHFYRHMGYCRGPSRIIWFAIGAGAATFWHKCHQMDYTGAPWGHCRRSAIQHQYPPPSQQQQQQPPASTNPDGSPMINQGQEQTSSFSFRDIPKRINNIPPANWEWGQERERVMRNQDSEEDRLAELRRQATETMSNMSETALQTIVSTAEVLKAKLAENRELRRKQEEELKQQTEEQSRNPPRPI